MITDTTDLKMKLIDAVSCSFSSCGTREEAAKVGLVIVEFFCAIGLDDTDYVDVLNACGGMDVNADAILDELIAEFSTE